MKNLFLTLGILLILSCSVFAQEWTWKLFSPNNTSWSILAPGMMQPDAEARDPNGSKGSYSYHDFNGFFAVIYRDSPKRWVPWKPDYNAYINRVRDDTVKANRGEMMEDTEFSNRGVVGREVHVKIPSGTTLSSEGQLSSNYRVQRFRMFFIGKRFFVVLAVLPENKIDTPAITNYFNSFSVNTAPSVFADSYSTDEDSTLTVNAARGVLANDADAELDTLTVSSAKPLTAPAHGSLTLNTNGSLTYKPSANYNGTDTFTYKANDGTVDSPTPATVTITIKSVNDAPTLSGVPSLTTVDELTPLEFRATATDIDSPAGSLQFSLTGVRGGATINAETGAFSWTPTEAQGGADYKVTVRLTDNGTPALSDAKTFRVHVNEINVAPILTPVGNKTIDEETLLSFKLTATDTDLPVNTLSYSLVNAPTGAAIDSATGAFTWTPTEAQGSDTYTVTFRATDNGKPALSDEENVTITVKEVNKAPVVSKATANTDEDTAISFNLKATDADIPSNTLRYSIVGAPAHGKLSGTAPNLTYTPNPDFNGTDNFTYKVNDGSLDSNTASVSINIKPVNDSPVTKSDSATTDGDVPVTVNVTGNDADVDGDAIVLLRVSNAVNGKVEIVGGEARFTPNPRFSGTGSFNYTISDGKGGTATGQAMVTVNLAKPKT